MYISFILIKHRNSWEESIYNKKISKSNEKIKRVKKRDDRLFYIYKHVQPKILPSKTLLTWYSGQLM